MKLTYLGTAAAEGFPALFCHCRHCEEARRLGGKSIRTRSQALVNDELLIDLPADTYQHFLQNGIHGDAIRYLLVTHGHQDHFYREELNLRSGAFAHDMRVPVLKLIASETLCKAVPPLPGVEPLPIRAFEALALDGYRVTALPARHMPGGDALFYVIEGDKTLLYAHDTGYFYEEVFDFIEQKDWVFDMISLDCTNIDLPIPDEGSHMGFPNIARLLKRLERMGATGEHTVRYVNHFSHNACPLHPALSENAAAYGCLVSYDGCEVIF